MASDVFVKVQTGARRDFVGGSIGAWLLPPGGFRRICEHTAHSIALVGISIVRNRSCSFQFKGSTAVHL